MSQCGQKVKMNKRVLFVIPYLYEGGAQRALSNIEMNFPDNWEVETLVNSEYKKAFPVKGKVHSLGLSKKPKTGSVIFQFRVFIKRIIKLRELKKTGRYDACISMSDSASIANILSGNKYCKTIISVRVSLMASARLPQYKYVVNPLAKLFYNSADKVVACSEELRKELVKDFGIKGDKVVAISNGYDIDKINRLSQEEFDDDDRNFIRAKKVVFNAGRLSRQKGQGHLIRAFKKVKEAIPNAVLIIAGEGEQEGYLRTLITDLGLTDSVRLVGHISNVYKYLRSSDVFVFPSLFEGFPNALAEAICAGVPCIATDFKTGAREILAPELMDDDKTITDAYYGNYGVISPLCSDKLLMGAEELELQEKILVDAIVDMLSDNDKSNHYKEQCAKRRKSLDIKEAVKKWVEIICL